MSHICSPTHPDSATTHQVPHLLTGTWNFSASIVSLAGAVRGNFYWVPLRLREASRSLDGHCRYQVPCRHCCVCGASQLLRGSNRHGVSAHQCLSPSTTITALKEYASPLSVPRGTIQTSSVSVLGPSVKHTFNFYIEPSLSLRPRYPLVNENELNNSHQEAHRSTVLFLIRLSDRLKSIGSDLVFLQGDFSQETTLSSY